MDLEKLGTFFLGHRVDPASGERTDEPILYDQKDLRTHAAIVGMTGSGKTGLGITLLEEAALDGVGAIVVDPKGDLANLLLTFPGLSAEEFAPFVDSGRSAEEVAGTWRAGLRGSGVGPDRIARMRQATDLALYTPGSSIAPLAVLGSLTPGSAVADDPEARAERIGATVSGLLAMLGVDADPVQSPAHVFLTNVLDHFAERREPLELGSLVRAILAPPIARVGVLDLDDFFGPADRKALAVRLNALVASPSFARWMEGPPLDVARMLATESGKPRVTVLSIAHLGEAERMFFVTLLLDAVIAWMRTQSGTSSLRALLYMDEVFGYLPPVREPPSKRLFLTLLKQARAYGLGLVLATQNPIDLDYKALSNCGTWWLGRLSTEQDVDRVIDGLRAAGAGLDAPTTRATLAGLDGRVFLMRNIHDDGPALFHTRWAMSYLRGPLTRAHLARLAGPRAPGARRGSVASGSAASGSARPPASSRAAGAPGGLAGAGSTAGPSRVPDAPRPAIPEHVRERFYGEPTDGFIFEPALRAEVQLRWTDRRADVDETARRELLAYLGADGELDWAPAADLAPTRAPIPDAGFGLLPRGALGKGKLRSAAADLKRDLAESATLTVLRCEELDLTGAPGEGHESFGHRVQQAVRERRDAAAEKLRAKFGARHEKLMRKVRRGEQKVEKERAQVKERAVDTALSVGTTVLGALFMRRASMAGHASRAATSARRAGRIAKERRDVAHAEEDLEELRAELLELESELEEAIDELDDEMAPVVEERVIRPSKRAIEVHALELAWISRSSRAR